MNKIVCFIGEDGKSGKTLWKTDQNDIRTVKVVSGKFSFFDEISFVQKLPASIYTLILQRTNQTSTRKLIITR